MNRIQRMNLFYLVLSLALLGSIAWILASGQTARSFFVLGAFLLAQGFFFLIPPSRHPALHSNLMLTLTAVILLVTYTFPTLLDPVLVLIFYLFFPLACIGLVGRMHTLLPIFLGIVTLLIHLLTDQGIQLEANGEWVFFSSYALVILTAGFIDRSNRNLLERLTNDKSLYEKQVQEKDEFISKLSHRLRTSLSNITLVNHLVHDGRLSSEQKELLETLRDSTNVLIEHVNNIVEIASPGIIDYKKSITSFNLARIIEESTGILGTNHMKQNPLEIKGTEQISTHLIGDPSLVRSLVVNMSKGLQPFLRSSEPLRLMISKIKETSSELSIKFNFVSEMEDPDKLAAHVDALKRETKSKSSGLANAYKLIVDSESNLLVKREGTATSLSFVQVFTKDPTRLVEAPVREEPPKPRPEKQLALQEANVLLVEDNEINQKIVLLSIRKYVSKIDVAKNGKIALEMFGLKQYDLVLMDIMMPVMDGLTATKKIREIESTAGRHVPIIAITANALAGDRDNCLAAGVDDYIAKPFQADVLIRMMQNLLAGSR
ncbi:MAG: response regulator [Bacteroidales bacterium]